MAGPGFINFTLKPEAISARAAELLRDERLGVSPAEKRHRIVIDFGSPNVAKPMHVGHIRSLVMGDALARIASFLGHDVIRDNHIGDWGTQFGMVIYGWKNLLDRDALARDPIAELVRIYKSGERTGQDGRAGARRLSPGTRQAARRRGGKPRHLERVRRAFDEGIRGRLRHSRHPLRHPARGKFLQRPPCRRGRAAAPIRPRGSERRRGLRFLPRYSRAGGTALHHSEKRRRFQLRHDRHCDDRLPGARPWRGHDLDRDRRAAAAAFQTDLRDRAARRLHDRLPPHHPRQHPWRGSQIDEDALGRKRAAARFAR